MGQTEGGEDIEINKRAATSDLLIYVNINLVAMDGGHKSVATGLASYKSLRHHHNPQTMQHSCSLSWTPPPPSCTDWRMGRFIAEAGVKIFQIETTLNTDTFPTSFAFLQSASGVERARPPPTPPPPSPSQRRRRAWPARSSTPSSRPMP